MATETIVQVAADAAYSGAGDMILNASERQLLQRPAMSWFCAPWLAAPEASGMVNSYRSAATAAYAAAISGSVLPTRAGYGGPDNAPYLQSGAANPVGALRTGSGIVNHPDAFTFAFVGRAGTNPVCMHMGVEGSTGNAFGVGLRTGDLAAVYTFDGAGAATLVTSAAATTADWHYVVVSYSAGSAELKIWVDAALADTVAGAMSFNTSRLNLFQAYDTGVAVASYAQSAELAAAWVINEYAGGADTTLIGLLDAAAAARFPSIFA